MSNDFDTNIADAQALLRAYRDETLPHFINGKRDAGRSGKTFESIAPSDNSVIGSISAGNATPDGVLPVITIDPLLEHQLLSSLREGPSGTDFQLEPDHLQSVIQAFRTKVLEVEQRGLSPVVLTSRLLRRPLHRLLALTEIPAPVLSMDELGSQVKVETQGYVLVPETNRMTINETATPVLGS